MSLLSILAVALSATVAPAPSPADAVRQVVTESYCNGAYNALDTTAMARGFHRDFAIFGVDGENLERYTIQQWIQAIEQRKAKPGFDLASAKRECELSTVDVMGEAAAVKVIVRRDGAVQYTDFLSLLHFTDGWKIVAKVYHEHG